MLEITDNEFEKIRDIMYVHTGVFLKPTKKQLIISRLHRRLGELNLAGFEDYIKIIEQPGSVELSNFVNAITTNETYFFRHASQFNTLYENILPAIVAKKKNGQRAIRIWSAACSTGEEPYSLAITCREFFKMHPDFTWNIYASDINDVVLEFAKHGVYPERSLRETPDFIRNKYFHEVPEEFGQNNKCFEIDTALKNNMEFLVHNLMEPFKYKDLDIVFLRNAMIYFDDAAKKKTLHHVANVIAQGGYFFVSLSESLKDDVPGFAHFKSAIYRKE